MTISHAAGWTRAELERADREGPVGGNVLFGMFLVASIHAQGGVMWCEDGRIGVLPARPFGGDEAARKLVLGVIGWAAPHDTRGVNRWGAS